MRTTNASRLHPFWLLGALALGACGSDPDGAGPGSGPDAGPGADATAEPTARLVIEGADALVLDRDERATLTVLYQDADGAPLVGDIALTVDGAAPSVLSAPTVTTSAEGRARIELTAPVSAGATFQVRASARDAEAVAWTVEVSAALTAADLVGSYALKSDIDIEGGAPGARQVLGFLADLVDEPGDPGTFLLDVLIDDLDNPVATLLINLARPELDTIVRDAILADDGTALATDIAALETELEGIISHLTLRSALAIAQGADGELRAVHTPLAWELDAAGQTHVLELAEPAPIEDLVITLAGQRDRIAVAQHRLPVAYGQILAEALDVALPAATGTDSVHELLRKHFDCRGLATVIDEAIDLGAPAVLEVACEIGLASWANRLANRLAPYDAVGLDIRGTSAAALAASGWGVERWIDGAWTTDVRFEDDVIALPAGAAVFAGDRVAE